jgi:erythrocyte band 7 integral membrane protein
MNNPDLQPLNNSESSDEPTTCYQSTIQCCGQCLGFLRTWLPCVCCCFISYPYQEIDQSYEGLLERFGRFVKKVSPGLQYVNPCTEEIQKINCKLQIIHLSKQVVLSKDNISLSLDASVYYKIIDSQKAIYSVKGISSAVSNLTFSTLRNTCGQHILQDLLEKREEVAKHIQDYVDEHANSWGVKVEYVFIKDINLSPEIQFALSSAAKERRLADSKIINAKADVESAKLMKKAAELLNSDAAMQIRFLETINHITKSPNVRVIFTPNE